MRLKSFLQSVLCLAVLASAGLMHGQAYTSVVVFGDSLSDTGNFASAVSSQYGLRYPGTSFNYSDGRFTNSTATAPPAKAYAGVWVEQVAAQFAAKPAVTDSLDGGTNYAYGEATTMDGTQSVSLAAGLSVTIPNMGQQITTYLATNPVPKATTLYVLFGGSNDLFADSSTAGVTAAAQREAALVQRLIAAGATQFLVPNVPPLGSTPQALGTPASAPLNAAAALFRTMLATDLQAVIAAATANGKTVTIAQPDLYTQTATVENTSMSYALTNATVSEQGITTSFPDTYLFWDGVHPTATGHHFIAAVTEATLAALSTSSTTATATSSTMSAALTLNAVVSGTGPTTKPSGLVTFYGTTGSTTTPLATAVLDATGTGTAAYTPAGANPTSVTAVYAGDTAYTNSTSPAVMVGATISPTTTVLTATSSALTVGTADTFTATVSSTGGVPAGTVTFYSGMAMLGTATLNGMGVATFTTSSLALGTDNITAVFPPSGSFGGSTSAVVAVVVTAPTVSITFSPSTLTVPHGSSGSTVVTVSSVGASGTVTFSCGTLPAHASCAFSPATVTLTGTGVQTSTLAVGTTAVSSLSLPAVPGSRGTQMAVYACSLLLFGLGAISRRKRWNPGLLAAALLLSLGTLTLGGCGGSSVAAPTTTTPGTYSVVVTATVSGSSAVTTQGTLSVVVQ